MKLAKNNYYTAKGAKKLNNYLVYINKRLVEEAGINPDKENKVYVEGNKIIIVNVNRDGSDQDDRGGE